jgi:hypothetical protein
MANNRELSQLGSFTIVNDINGKIGIATTTATTVGIGTTKTQAKLHVVSDAIIGELKITSAGIVTSNSPGVTTVKYYGDGSNLIGVNAFNVVGQPLISNPVYPTFASNIGVTSVGIASTQIAYIPNFGFLGIGTTGPTQRLDVFGNLRVRGGIYDSTNSAGNSGFVLTSNGADIVWSSAGGIGIVTNAAGLNGQLQFNSVGIFSGTNQVWYDVTSGNLGINTQYPRSDLDVVGGTELERVRITGVTTIGQVQITTSGIVTSANPGVTTVVYYGDGSNLFGVSAFAVINQPIATDIVFPTLANNTGVSSVGIATTGTNSFVFQPLTGNIGLGSTQPAYKVDAVGDINITGDYKVNGRSVLDDALIYSIVFG